MGRPSDAVVLGLVQGVTEWLPISSSGHLALIRRFFSLEGGIAFDVFLHGASLAVILIFFRRDIAPTIAAFCRLRRGTREFGTAVNVLIATAVTGVLGLLLREREPALAQPAVIGAGYLVTAALLFLSRRDGFRRVNGWRAAALGLVQGIALVPGISRSGSTIAGAKILGIGREEAFTFSFLMAVPAIAAAIVLEGRHLAAVEPGFLLAGFATAFAVSFPSLLLLRRAVVGGRFHLFGWYCLLMAAASFAVALLRP